MGDNVSRTLVINSRFEEIDQLEPFLKKIRQDIGFSDERFSQVRLAVNEAVTNAILHGNNQDPSKEVTIVASADDELLNISVQDEGSGFNPDDLDDPLKEENLLKDSGRGIFLIKQNADKVTFSKKGTKIVMQYRFLSLN